MEDTSLTLSASIDMKPISNSIDDENANTVISHDLAPMEESEGAGYVDPNDDDDGLFGSDEEPLKQISTEIHDQITGIVSDTDVTTAERKAPRQMALSVRSVLSSKNKSVRF